MEAPDRKGLRALWSRRWFRRTTYTLVTGTVLAGSAAWALRRPAVTRWAIARLGEVVKQETGLDLELRDLELHLLRGRVVALEPRLGGGLFAAQRLEGAVSLGALLLGDLHVREIRLDSPRIRLDAALLKQIKLRDRPRKEKSPEWRVDLVSVRNGTLEIDEPAWGLPPLRSTFAAHGQGKGTNRLHFFVDLTELEAGSGAQALKGRLAAQGEVDHDTVNLGLAALKLGRSQLSLQGKVDAKTEKFNAASSGSVDLGQLRRLLAPGAGDAAGTVDFKAEAWGQARQPLWKLAVDGRDLQSEQAGLQPGALNLAASGTPSYATIHRVAWRSEDGTLEAEGSWRKGQGSQLKVTGRQVGLAPVATLARVGFLSRLRVDLEGDAYLPGDPWNVPPLDKVELNLQVAFAEGGQDAGRAAVTLKEGALGAEDMELRLPELSFQGRASGLLGRKGLRAISGEGVADTEAAVVAEVLRAWGIGFWKGVTPRRVTTAFPMSGQVHAQAKVRWNPAEGLQLAAEGAVQQPGWYGARADQVRAEVSIDRDQLRVENIELTKGEGRGWGELWLTWADLPEGVDQLDMCYRGTRLPIEEGLKAADLDPEIIRIQGLGGGWVRLWGPFAHIRIEGGAQAEAASVYGLRIPAARGDFSLDIEGERIQVQNFRAGESLAALGRDGEEPSGALALQGGMDMNYDRRTWYAWLRGNLDSEPIGLPGPRFQAKVDARLDGPWIQPLGAIEVPRGQVAFTGGRLFLGAQSIEGLEGMVRHDHDGVAVQVGMLGKAKPFLALEGWQTANGLVAALGVDIGEDSADTSHLASRLSRDLLRDARVVATAEGTWGQAGFDWKARLNAFVGSFDGFQLTQDRPASLSGDDKGVDLDLRLLGRTGAADPEAGRIASFRASGRMPFDLQTPMALKLEGQAELAKLKPVVAHLMELDSYSLLGDLEPRGAASFELALGGPYPEPRLDGDLRLKQGSLSIKGYPQSVENLGFNIHFKDREILLPESDPARGTLAQGRLALWGRASWGFGGLDSYDLQARLKDFEFRDIPEGFELQGDLDASLRGGDAEGGLLKGALRANRMLYRADINLRDLILNNALGGLSGSGGLDPEDPLARIDLDLDLQLVQPWVFETNLLKLQGRPDGPFKVQGTLAQPGLKGRMMFLPGGRVTNLLPAGDIVLERGSIDFLDPRSRNPLLDLQGRVDVTPYLVNLQIRGTLDGLEMTPTSTPSLRRDEITAILIDPSLAPTIGTSSSASSAMSYGLAKTSSGLLTTLALADFQERVRRTFNLDRVNVAWRPGSAGTSESIVTLGKTITFQNWQVPFVFTHKKAGEVTTLSGQFEWRLGSFVLQLGASQSGASGLNPAGEIRHSWSPK